MKTRTMMKVLIATVATIGVSSAAMAYSAGRNSDVAAPKVTGKPKPVDECVFVRQMKYADATDVKTCIDTLVTESRKEDVLASCATNAVDCDRGLIRGKIVVAADKRRNKLIIITTRPNMDFLDQVIEQLDVDDISPSVVKEFRFRNAYAEDSAQTINDFFGAPNVAVEGFVKARADKRINGLVVMAEKRTELAVVAQNRRIDLA